MKNNARQDKGSTESLRTPLSKSATPTRRFEVRRENPTKMQPKCNQKRECHFFKCSVSTAYNFDTLNRSHFSTARLSLPAGKPRSVVETHSIGMLLAIEGRPFSLGEKVRMRDKLVTSVCPPRTANSLRRLYSEKRIKPYKTE
jgi:hypothetical protein